MKAEEYGERKTEAGGWPVNLASYRIGDEWHAKADNVSPGAALCRAAGRTREDAEQKALERAAQMLGQTRRRAV